MRGTVGYTLVAILLTAGPALAQPKKPDVVAKLEGHRGGVGTIAYALKGNRLATGSGNGAVRLWDAKTGEIIGRIDDGRHNSARVTHLAFSADGRYLSSSSRTMAGAWDLGDPKRIALRYEDPNSADAGKIGIVSGDGQLLYFTGVENNAPVLSTYGFGTRAVGKIHLPPKLRPVSLTAIADSESALVAAYCLAGEKNESASIALIGLGEPRVLADGVPPPLAGKPISLGFAADRKWLVVSNGSKVAYWSVPGSQVIEGASRVLPGDWSLAGSGPGNRIAVATPSEEGKAVTVKIFDIGTDPKAAPKTVAEYSSGIKRVSVLAFSPDGAILAVGDDAEGVVQLWALK